MSIKDEFINAANKDAQSFYDVSVMAKLSDTAGKVIKTAFNSKPIQDHYTNTLTSTGGADKVQSFSSYGFNNDTLNWPLWLALYNDSWVFRRAINKPAQDEINCGFTLHGDQDYTRVYKAYARFKTPLTELLMWGALFGGSIAVMIFDTISDEEMSLPLNKEKIKKAKLRLYVTDRWYGVGCSNETVTNMKDIDYGKPKYYDVTFADGRSYRVHHSYVLRYEHYTAPKLVKNGQLQGWGYAEGAHILNELSRDDQLKSAITSLVNKSLIEVIKMSGMRGVFMGTDQGNEEQLRKRLEMVNWGRTFNSLTFLDKDDDYQEHGFSQMSGLSDLLEKNMWLISAALEMQGILYGDLRGGLSQSNDDLERYAGTIENRCNAYYRPVLQKFLMILFIMYDIEGTVDFDFNSLVEHKLNVDKMEAIDKLKTTISGLIEVGVISKYQAAKAVDDFINRDKLVLTVSEEALNKLKVEEEFELLESLKQIGKNSKLAGEIMKNQFPNGYETSTGLEGMEPGVDAPDLPPALAAAKEEVANQEEPSAGTQNEESSSTGSEEVVNMETPAE